MRRSRIVFRCPCDSDGRLAEIRLVPSVDRLRDDSRPQADSRTELGGRARPASKPYNRWPCSVFAEMTPRSRAIERSQRKTPLRQ